MNCISRSYKIGFVSGRINLVAFTILIVVITNCAYAQVLNDYPEVVFPKPEMIHEPAGAFIKLKCELKPCIKSGIIKWEFKACGPDLPNKPKCDNSEINPWIPIHVNRNVNHCAPTFVVEKSSGNNSGLYKCSYKQHEHEELKIIKMFQVHVVEPYWHHVKNGTKPILLGIEPLNTTIIEHLRIVIQCKAYSDSLIPPAIWWLKHVDAFPFYNNPSIIHDKHNNKTYLKLNSSQMALGNYTYVSKLIIEKSNENDTGVYTCVAVNNNGKSNKDVYIDVIALEKDWQGTTSFSILFLIPLGFALIPISGWLCVYCYRKKKLRKLEVENNMPPEICKYQLMPNRSNFNRHDMIYNPASQRIV